MPSFFRFAHAFQLVLRIEGARHRRVVPDGEHMSPAFLLKASLEATGDVTRLYPARRRNTGQHVLSTTRVGDVISWIFTRIAMPMSLQAV